jgi:hypothetical protein
MTDKQSWGTSSIYLAAAVMALGMEYDKCDKTDHRKMIFYFVTPEDKADMEKYFGNLKFDFELVERQWTNRSLMVNASRYAESLQALKSVIHSL